MTTPDLLRTLRDFIQVDVGHRGLARDPGDNLFTACPDDFANACQSIAAHPAPRVGIVTGFMIPSIEPPTGETDGPPGALFLAKAFRRLGIPCVLASDLSGLAALSAGSGLDPLTSSIETIYLPDWEAAPGANNYWLLVTRQMGQITHLIALERVGPSHTTASVRAQPISTLDTIGHFVCAVPRSARDRCYTMRGRDITDLTAPAHLLFEGPRDYVTIGVGDGGNEIGMGKVPYDTIRKNIPDGETVACRVATDFLIVAGVSNWGAYALAAGVMVLKGRAEPDLFDPAAELKALDHLVSNGPLVDGVRGTQTATVDGLDWEAYARPLQQMREALASWEKVGVV